MKLIGVLVSLMVVCACGGAPAGGSGAPTSSSPSSASSASSSGTPADAGTPSPTKAEAMAMMELVLNDPFRVRGEESRGILAFVASDNAVKIVIAPGYVPWMEESLQEDLSSMFLLAYLSGNALSQLKAGKSGDDFRAGMRGALHVYKQLKPQGVVSKKLEELLALEARGELEAHFNQIEVKQPASAAQ